MKIIHYSLLFICVLSYDRIGTPAATASLCAAVAVMAAILRALRRVVQRRLAPGVGRLEGVEAHGEVRLNLYVYSKFLTKKTFG